MAPNVEAVQEMKVMVNTYDAQYGRSGGGVVNVLLKSGTNELHGTAYEFVRNDKLSANDFFLNRAGKPRAPLRYNRYGGTIGGPIVKDKLFFFVGYQPYFYSVDRTVTNGTISGLDNLQTVTYTVPAESNLAWSPDSKQIVYSSDRNGDSQLFLYDFTNDSETQLTHSKGGDTDSVFSPDGKMIAFERDGREVRIYDVCNPQRAKQRQPTTAPTNWLF